MNAIKLLKQDHKQVSTLFDEFEDAQQADKGGIAEQICQELTVHAQIEEELLYPAARDKLEADDQDLVDEAAVEHATVKDLVSQIQASGESEPLFAAKVKVLGEYVKHHVKEEEGELFPKLEGSTLDLEALGAELAVRKAELLGEDVAADDAVADMQRDAPRKRGAKSARTSNTIRR